MGDPRCRSRWGCNSGPERKPSCEAIVGAGRHPSLLSGVSDRQLPVDGAVRMPRFRSRGRSRRLDCIRVARPRRPGHRFGLVLFVPVPASPNCCRRQSRALCRQALESQRGRGAIDLGLRCWDTSGTHSIPYPKLKIGNVAISRSFPDAGGGTRTPDTRIMIPLVFPAVPGDSADFGREIGLFCDGTCTRSGSRDFAQRAVLRNRESDAVEREDLGQPAEMRIPVQHGETSLLGGRRGDEGVGERHSVVAVSALRKFT